jgi:hypothetical protein
MHQVRGMCDLAGITLVTVSELCEKLRDFGLRRPLGRGASLNQSIERNLFQDGVQEDPRQSPALKLARVNRRNRWVLSRLVGGGHVRRLFWNHEAAMAALDPGVRRDHEPGALSGNSVELCRSCAGRQFRRPPRRKRRRRRRGQGQRRFSRASHWQAVEQPAGAVALK